ncbi:hypothetical protein KP509_26G061900 [Ceratopteris richardii]|uniref:Uncharacterized protein n=1 Tax=Ceratopteris richardii TaxID=49495 RepID=A0A8T2RNK1_CERRI|nr:hypothetical protein KP509_26G061900 [Ceratopteris richardii]
MSDSQKQGVRLQNSTPGIRSTLHQLYEQKGMAVQVHYLRSLLNLRMTDTDEPNEFLRKWCKMLDDLLLFGFELPSLAQSFPSFCKITLSVMKPSRLHILIFCRWPWRQSATNHHISVRTNVLFSNINTPILVCIPDGHVFLHSLQSHLILVSIILLHDMFMWLMTQKLVLSMTQLQSETHFLTQMNHVHMRMNPLLLSWLITHLFHYLLIHGFLIQGRLAI